MKKILTAAALVLCVHSATFAQEARTPEAHANRQTEMLTETLKLNEDQRTKIYEVNQKTAQQMQKSADEKNKGDMRAIQSTKDEAYRKILTAEQYQRYEEMKAKRREAHTDRMDANQKPAGK